MERAGIEFEVPRIIARIVDPANTWMYEEDMGVDVVLGPADEILAVVHSDAMGDLARLLVTSD